MAPPPRIVSLVAVALLLGSPTPSRAETSSRFLPTQAAFITSPTSTPPLVTYLSTSTTHSANAPPQRPVPLEDRRRPFSFLAASRREYLGGDDGGRLPASATSESDMVSDLEVASISAGDDDDDGAAGQKQPHLRAYWEILRPHNVPASFGLVAAGALVASHSAAALLELKVILTAFAAASVAVGSCVLNDWFDIDLDRVNKPERPLVTGEVVPLHALGIGMALLLGAVASAWAVHPVALQATIVASVALTSAYTPVLKPIPLVKNLAVAGVVAAAIAAGGLASGAGVSSTLAPSVLTFFVIAHREILMDVTDVEGDTESGVRTLPVLLGRQTAVVVAALLLTAGVGCAGAGVVSGTSESTRPIAVALTLLFVSPLYANIATVVRSGYSQEALSSAINQALGPLALVLGLMGVVLQ